MHPTAPTTIHINPNFRKIHINPMFLNKPSLAAPAPAPESTLSVPVALPKPTNIHINPRFLNNSKLLSGLSRLVDDAFESDYSCASSEDDGLDVEPEMIIAHIPSQINRKLVRKPVIPATTRAAEPSEMLLAPSRSNYLKIGSRKLIRAPSTRLKVQHKPKMHRKPMQTKYKIVKEHTTYKIDRRSAHMKLKLVPVAQLHLTSTRQKLLRMYDAVTWVVARELFHSDIFFVFLFPAATMNPAVRYHQHHRPNNLQIENWLLSRSTASFTNRQT